MEINDSKELWDKISELQAHITKCEVERSAMTEKIENLEKAKERGVAWQMRLVAIFAGIIMTLGGGLITMYSTQNSQQVQIEKMDKSISKIGDGLGGALDEQATLRTEVAKNTQSVDALYVEIEDRKMYSVKNTDEINKLKEFLYKKN